MEKKIIVLGSILAASAVTIALCVMGNKKEEGKSNFTAPTGNAWILNCIAEQQAANPSGFDLESSAQACQMAYNKRKFTSVKTASKN
jgi:hypothetical protein